MTTNKLHKDFLNACKRFKVEQLQQDILADFLPNNAWEEIRKEIKRAKLFINHKVLGIFLLQAIENKPDVEILEKIKDLHFLDNVYNHYKKTWSVFSMGKQTEFISAGRLKMKLEESVKLHNLSITVRTEAHGFMMWLMLLEKNKKTNKYHHPFYCAFTTDTNYLFASRNIIPVQLQKVLVNTFQCDSLKYCDLFGKNIRGLLRLLRHKSSSSSLSTQRQLKKNFKPDVVRSRTGNDYTLEKQAKSSIRNLFVGEPQFETLSVKVTGYRLSPGQTKVDSALVYKSRNIPRFLESLAGLGILKMPVAEYITMFPSKGKNALMCVVEQ